MSKTPDVRPISQSRSTESLHKALDQLYHNLLEAAKSDWQQLFADADPSDACVTVRISKEQIADELAGIPRAGVASIRRAKAINGKIRRRTA